MIDLLGRLVEIESPSDDREGLDQLADVLGTIFRDFGSVERCAPDDPQRGAHLRLTVAGANDSEPHAAALCHFDTVWPKGTLQRIPFSVDAEGVARGPGCFDMKGGIVVLWFALQALRERGLRPRRRLSPGSSSPSFCCSSSRLPEVLRWPTCSSRRYPAAR